MRLLLLLLLLAGCDSQPQGPTRAITWTKSADPEADCIKAGAEKPLIGYIRGCSLPRREPCEIIARDSDKPQDLITLGHELRHCFNGVGHS